MRFLPALSVQKLVSCLAFLAVVFGFATGSFEAAHAARTLSPEEWIQSYEKFQSKLANNEFAHQGAIRGAVRELIAPYVGLTFEGRVAVIQRFTGLGQKQAISKVQEVHKDGASQEIYVFDLLINMDGPALLYPKTQEDLLQFVYQQIKAGLEGTGPSIEPWTDWALSE